MSDKEKNFGLPKKLLPIQMSEPENNDSMPSNPTTVLSQFRGNLDKVKLPYDPGMGKFGVFSLDSIKNDNDLLRYINSYLSFYYLTISRAHLFQRLTTPEQCLRFLTRRPSCEAIGRTPNQDVPHPSYRD